MAEGRPKGRLCRLSGGRLLAVSIGISIAANIDPLRAAPADFFQGRPVELIVGAAVGGGYDAYARFLARHIGRFIPGNPVVIVKNMPGAGGRIAANYLASRAPRDGTSFEIFQNTLTLDQLAQTANINFDMRRFNWIGNMNVLSTVCVTARHVKLESPQAMLDRQFVVGGSNTGSSLTIIPYILNSLVKTKFKIVKGYTGTNDVLLAMERGEMDGMCGWGWDSLRVQALDQVERQDIRLALDIGTDRHPELRARHVPFVMDMLPDSTEKLALRLLLDPQNYGRPFAMPEGVPADRVEALRSAFRSTLEDPAFLADAGRAQLEIRYTGPTQIEAMIRSAFETAQVVRDRAVSVLSQAEIGP